MSQPQEALTTVFLVLWMPIAVAGAYLCSLFVKPPATPPDTLTVAWVVVQEGQPTQYIPVTGYVSAYQNYTVAIQGPTQTATGWNGPYKIIYITPEMFDALP